MNKVAHKEIQRMPTVVACYLGRRGSGPEYSYEMTRGLTACGANVYAIVSAHATNIEAWRALPLKGLIEVETSDHYSGATGALWKFFTREIPRIRRQFRGVKVDAFYVPMTHPLTYPLARVFRRMGAKTVMTIHDVWPHKGEKNLHYLPVHLGTKLLGRMADKIVLLSKSFIDYTSEHYGRRRDDIVVIPHGMFYDECPDRGPAPQPLARYNFLFFGRIVEYKGVDLLTEAYRMLAAERSDTSLRVIGSGDVAPYEKILEGCDNVVIDNRFVEADEVVDFFRMPHTIAVLPYREASQSGVIPIAMKEGAQLIVSRLAGLLEQTADGTLALTCEPDAASLYLAMNEAIVREEQLASMRVAAEEHIRSLSWPALAQRLLDEIK